MAMALKHFNLPDQDRWGGSHKGEKDDFEILFNGFKAF